MRQSADSFDGPAEIAMQGSLTGDFAALERFGQKVGELGGTRSLTALNKALGAEAIVQARDGFREERDPLATRVVTAGLFDEFWKLPK